jgi:hypothetical protein
MIDPLAIIIFSCLVAISYNIEHKTVTDGGFLGVLLTILFNIYNAIIQQS